MKSCLTSDVMIQVLYLPAFYLRNYMNSSKFFDHLGKYKFQSIYGHIHLLHYSFYSNPLCFLSNCRKDKEIRSVIFVERIVTAKVIIRILKKIECLSHLKVAYVTGLNTSVDALTPKVLKETLESFRRGEVCVKHVCVWVHVHVMLPIMYYFVISAL